jgi:hypothetical protein
MGGILPCALANAPKTSPNTNVPANRRTIVLVLPHAIGTSRHGVPAFGGTQRGNVAKILHALAVAIAALDGFPEPDRTQREFVARNTEYDAAGTMGLNYGQGYAT